MNCECYNRINTGLKDKNLRVVGYTLLMPDFTTCPTVETEWIDREKAPKGQKRNPTKMLASHCPFCGIPVDPNKDNSRPG